MNGGWTLLPIGTSKRRTESRGCRISLILYTQTTTVTPPHFLKCYFYSYFDKKVVVKIISGKEDGNARNSMVDKTKWEKLNLDRLVEHKLVD